MSKPNKPLLVGITGGIGSGKSLISNIFKVFNVPVYDADTRAKWLMVNDSELKSQIMESFGSESYENGNLNRQYLATRVFSDQNKVKQINALVHPAVAKDFESWVNENNGKKYLLKEAALLIESGSYQHIDSLITVYASEEVRIKRVLERDPQRTKEQVQAIIQKQISEEERQDKADFVINNEGYDLVIPQVLKLHNRFIYGS